jgi:hypothetical protein
VSFVLCVLSGEEKTKGNLLNEGVFIVSCSHFETLVEIAPPLFGSDVGIPKTGKVHDWSTCPVRSCPVVENDGDARNARLGDWRSAFRDAGSVFGIGDVAVAESAFRRNSGAQ